MQVQPELIWIDLIVWFLKDGMLLAGHDEVRKLKYQASKYLVIMKIYIEGLTSNL